MNFEPNMILIVLIIFISTCIRSTFGFGDALVSMPLLAILIGLKTATPLVAMVAITIAFTILVRNWRSVQIKSAWRLIVSTLVGIPLGLILLKGSYEEVMKLILAVVLIGFSCYRLIQPRRWMLRNEKSAFIFGFIAGILGGAYNTNGPAIVVYGSLRKWSPETFRATLQGYFFPTGLLILIGHGSAGLWTNSVLQYYIVSFPLILLAIWIGGRLHRTIPKGRFDYCIYALLILIGLYLFAQTIWGILF